MERSLLLNFGEILWDRFPDTRRPGGSPFNVSIHAHHLGLDARLLSAVGRDPLGDELLAYAADCGLSTGLLERLDAPTGVVDVAFDAHGEPSYAIADDAAWDRIPCGRAELDTAEQAAGLVFASLAQRSAANRRSLDALLGALPDEALIVFDLNLRPPHVDRARIESLVALSNVVKCNRDEWTAVREWFSLDGSDEEAARRLMERTRIEAVLITLGSDGAMVVPAGGGLVRQGVVPWEEAKPGEGDLVGVGDAFLAAVVASRITGGSWEQALGDGARYAGWVASQSGAAPRPDRALLDRLIQQ